MNPQSQPLDLNVEAILEELSEDELQLVKGGDDPLASVTVDKYPNHVFGAGRINAFKSLTAQIGVTADMG